jgi:deazaflavin-dependent oxidoreductase (nitroreductase family)
MRGFGIALRRWLAHVNRRVTNRLVGPVARYLPGFGVVVHTGRKTGRRYRTPVNVFRGSGGYVIALTYGTRADWVRNVRSAEGCTLETRGRVLRLTRPRLYRDDEYVDGSPSLRTFGKFTGAAYFLELTEEDGGGEHTQPASAV